MVDDTLPKRGPERGFPGIVRRCCSWSTFTVALGAGILGVWAVKFESHPVRHTVAFVDDTLVPAGVARIDPEALSLLRTAMLEANAKLAADEAKPEPTAEAPVATVPVPEPDSSQGMALALVTPVPKAIRVPLPMRRPADLAQLVPVPEAPRLPSARLRRQASRQAAAVAPAPAPERSLLEQFFGIGEPQKPAPALAYAALDNGPVDKTFRKGLSAVPQASTPIPVPFVGSAKTAVYDITARVVHMPNGETLEAHSGYGPAMDDPRHVHVPMRGPTPPGTYDLTEREATFHGVRAIRLTPVGGTAPFGRVGLLAHTYMLQRQPGASNGCVVFRDYDRFLQAFLRGDVTRLVVVASRA